MYLINYNCIIFLNIRYVNKDKLKLPNFMKTQFTCTLLADLVI